MQKKEEANVSEVSGQSGQPERPQIAQQGKPSSWTAALAGTAPFLVFGLFLIILEIPHNWVVPAWLANFRGPWILGILVLLPIGLGIGWVKGFPRWSYPYVGLVPLFSLYMMVVATPGLRVFNYTFGSNDLWGWRALLPLLAVAVIALLITRSLQPVTNLFTNVRQDWTLLTFGMFGFMPLFVMIGFDEVDRLYSLPFMVALTLVMVGTVLAYLRSRHPWQRVLALLAGIILTVVVATVAPRAYWLPNPWVNVTGAVIGGAVVVAVMFSPGLVGLLRHSINSIRAMGNA